MDGYPIKSLHNRIPRAWPAAETTANNRSTLVDEADSARILLRRGNILPNDHRQTLPAVTGRRGADFLWLIELQGRVVGLIGLVHCDRHIVRICRFRIDPSWQHTAVLRKLIQSVHEYCRDHGCLKVLLEVGTVPHWLLVSLGRQGFQFMRRKRAAGREMLEFYVDLYSPCRDDE